MKNTSLLMMSSLYSRSTSDGLRRHLAAAPAPMICYVSNGDGKLVIDGHQYDVKPQQLYYIPTGVAVELDLKPGFGQFCVIFMRHIQVSRKAGVRILANTARADFQESGIQSPKALHANELSALLEAIHRMYDSNNGGSAEGHALFQSFLHAVLTADASVMPASAEAALCADDGIERSLDYMRSHFSSKIKLETLAGLSGLTPTSYSREFKKRQGVSPTEFLTSCRINAAKQLLAEQTLTVKQVSAETGFGNEFYFSRMFKREVGMSPTLYMRRHLIRVAVTSSFRFEDTLLSLGIQPVIATNCHKSKTMSQEEHLDMLAKRLQAIRDAEPELILCDHYHRDYLDRLKDIAPTVCISLSMDWRVVHRQIAEVIGREREAEHNFNLLDARLSAARSQLSERFGGRTVAFLRVVHKLIRIQGSGQHPLNDLLHAELGLTPGFCVPSNMKHVEFSPQKYPNMDSNLLFIQNNYFHPEDESVFRGIASSPQWLELQAVRSGGTIFVDNWISRSWSPAGRAGIIDELLAINIPDFSALQGC